MKQLYSRLFISRKIICLDIFDVKWVLLSPASVFADIENILGYEWRLQFLATSKSF